MLKHCVASSFLLLMSAFVAGSAHAFIDPPWITPAEPKAGETVYVNIRMGICDATAERPGYPQVTQEGSAIHIIEFGDHTDFEDFCIFGVGTATDRIGTFQAGDYELTVDFLYNDFLLGYTIMPLGVIPFSVTGAEPAAPVPIFGTRGLSVMLLFIIGFGCRALWVRRRSSF